MARIEEELAGKTTYAPNNWLATLFSSHNIDERRSLGYIKQPAYYIDGRWDIPNFDPDAGNLPDILGLDDPVDRMKHLNDQTQRRFMDIMNDIIHHFGQQDSRRALMTDSTEDEHDDVNLNYRKYYSPKFST